MKIVKWILILLLAAIGIIYLYLSNTEVFYPEYWLQRRIVKTEQAKTNLKLSDRYLSYRFHHDKTVDLTIDISDNGVVKLTHGEWISADVGMNKELEYHLDSKTFEQLRSEFLNNWPQSFTKDADDKFGGTYYELSLTDHANKQIDVNYYNIVPSDTLNEFKNQLIELANEVLKGK